jgi:hypothetical protein
MGFYNGWAVTCRYVIPEVASLKSSLEETLDQAIALTVLEHPLMQVGILKEDSRAPSWVRLDQIDLRKQVKWLDVSPEQDYEQVLLETISKEHNTTFFMSESTPLWRVTILKHTNSNAGMIDIIFIGNHANGDGTSGKVFQNTLLEKLNAVSNGEAAPELTERVMAIPFSSVTTPAQEKLMKFPVSLGFAISEGWAELRPPFLVSESNYFVNWAPLRDAPNTTRLTVVRTGSDVLNGVLDACRQNKTTLTSLLQVLGLLSLSIRVPKETALAFQHLTSISLRPYMPSTNGLDPEKTYCNIVTPWLYEFDDKTVSELRLEVEKAISSSHTGLMDALWRVAGKFRVQLSKKLALGSKNDQVGLLPLVHDSRTYLKDLLKKPRAVTLEVSNIGVVNSSIDSTSSDKPNQWTTEQAAFTQSSWVTGGVILVSCASAKGKGLSLNVTWQKEILPDDSLGLGITTDLHSWLECIGNNTPLVVGDKQTNKAAASKYLVY